MRISAGVEMLQLTARAFDQDIILNPTLVWNNDEAILRIKEHIAQGES
ncbi:hypothetical protein P4652_16585 [Priestia megaterium]|jgi:hypothetical protein|nr:MULTISPECIES: hypothetical protein [Priestia]MCM3305998.1 hypothetical protein [Priestia megaterium]MED4139837.1 hypothetical protein [Priestia megaterium]